MHGKKTPAKFCVVRPLADSSLELNGHDATLRPRVCVGERREREANEAIARYLYCPHLL